MPHRGIIATAVPAEIIEPRGGTVPIVVLVLVLWPHISWIGIGWSWIEEALRVDYPPPSVSSAIPGVTPFSSFPGTPLHTVKVCEIMSIEQAEMILGLLVLACHSRSGGLCLSLRCSHLWRQRGGEGPNNGCKDGQCVSHAPTLHRAPLSDIDFAQVSRRMSSVGRAHLSRSELRVTSSYEFAMARAAMSGVTKPKAASGTATAL